MARTELDRAVTPSLLDRLTDLDTQQLSDAQLSRDASARAYRLGVQRDVELLLNTRRTIVEVSDAHPELRRSVHEYGVPDLTGRYMDARGNNARIVTDIRDTLQRFEPRLTKVTVTMQSNSQVLTPQVRFTISATLRMDPGVEQIVFDTVFEVARGTFEIAERS